MGQQLMRAGSMINVAEPDEVYRMMSEMRADILSAFFHEMRGVRHISANAEASTAGTLELRVGSPTQSFVWLVQALMVTGPNPLVNIAGQCAVYRGDVSPATLMDFTDPSDLTTSLPNMSQWQKGQFVIGAEESITVQFAGLASGQEIWAAAHVIEIPRRMLEKVAVG